MISMPVTESFATNLSCAKCGAAYPIDKIQYFSTCCEQPLLVEYRYGSLNKADLAFRENTMWRYHEMLPLLDLSYKVSLGEGMTPLLPLTNLASQFGFEHLLVKDEGLNPTGSFKARGISVAVSKAKELGIAECVIPTAGNAGGALSAYCAAANIKATVIMPVNTPEIFKQECKYFGAELFLVDGLIDKCGQLASKIQFENEAFNMATLKEPYRLEGKKTMGYEIAEQLNWQLPDIIVYPTGGGTGLIGIWKAFHEMINMGWIKNKKLPKMVVVQSTSCRPMVDLITGINGTLPDESASIANGLMVPNPFGKDLILKVIEESHGLAVAVNEEQIFKSVKEIWNQEGMAFSPEGAATWAAVKILIEEEKIDREEKILLLNTGSGYKYLENFID